MKLRSNYLNPFQPFPERELDNESEERPGPAIEDNMSRAVFSALANAEDPKPLATFVKQLAEKARYGTKKPRDAIAGLAGKLLGADSSKVEVGLQTWPVDEVKELSGRNVHLIGISSCSDWTHDKRLASSKFRADAWIYVRGEMLLVFEFKKDEPLDATQVSAYIHALELPERNGIQRAEPGSNLPKEHVQAVQEACKELMIDAD